MTPPPLLPLLPLKPLFNWTRWMGHYVSQTSFFISDNRKGTLREGRRDALCNLDHRLSLYQGWVNFETHVGLVNLNKAVVAARDWDTVQLSCRAPSDTLLLWEQGVILGATLVPC